MPTTIKKAHALAIRERILEISNIIRARTNLFHDKRQIELLYSTPAELEIADEVMQWCNLSQVSIRNPQVELRVGINHPLADYTTEHDILFDLDHVYYKVQVLWPKQMVLRPDRDPDQYADLITRIQYMVHQRMGCVLLYEVVDWMLDAHGTLEQVRYRFPPIVPILRGMDREFRKIADSIETIKSKLSLPELVQERRKKLRHVCEFWAQHELLETLHGRAKSVQGNCLFVDLCPQRLDFGTGEDAFHMLVK